MQTYDTFRTGQRPSGRRFAGAAITVALAMIAGSAVALAATQRDEKRQTMSTQSRPGPDQKTPPTAPENAEAAPSPASTEPNRESPNGARVESTPTGPREEQPRREATASAVGQDPSAAADPREAVSRVSVLAAIQGVAILVLFGIAGWLYSKQREMKAAADSERTNNSNFRSQYSKDQQLRRGRADELSDIDLDAVQSRFAAVEARHREAAEQLKSHARLTAETQAGVDAVGEATQRLSEELKVTKTSLQRASTRAEATAESLAAVQTRVSALENRDLENLFDTWKNEHLNAVHADNVRQALAGFLAEPERQRSLEESRLTLNRVLERAKPWFGGLSNWEHRLARCASATDQRDVRKFAENVAHYRRRGDDLLERLDRALADSNFVERLAGIDLRMSFADVVSGRSAESLSRRYIDALIKQFDGLLKDASTLPQEWDDLRSELPSLLDVYRALAASSASDGLGEEGSDVDEALSKALVLARISEIEVVPTQTRFDPSVHEPLAQRLERSDLAANTIVSVQSRGFFHEGKVLRRALVTLSS